ncbi:zf-TFIIB domain-containing protein [Pseudomonas leptonychotis]|uniref:Transcription factor zinc-finger domain-containing protein n=1 Tax=Pseudomonas leptonychotis TaxID=2448482 RepID=A0A4T2A1A8_9PSED|nr:zf-TFIIB domain-containing protein [Pseudomonas leptonychotis]TIH09508.1 hypothetical protein D8779_02040 [Pseudomonas leptonychotis]
MQCPKCQSAMEKVPTQDGVVDRCVACKGLWFDMLEHEDLKAYAKMLDVGCDEQGQVHNKIDRISCPSCFGSYFDAGEFRDLASFTLSDFLKRFALTARN